MPIEKAAVLGAGVMGAQIAAHLTIVNEWTARRQEAERINAICEAGIRRGTQVEIST